MKISTLAAGIALSALMVTGAIASDLNGKSLKDDDSYVQGTTVNWSGFYVGGQLGYGIDIFGVEGYNGGVALEGFAGGLKVGYDLALGRFLVGAFGEYNWSDINIADALSVDNDWTIGARAGVIVAPKTMVYGLVGWSQAELSAGTSSETYDGVKAGGGVEFAIASNLFANLEVSHTWYDLDEGDGEGSPTFEDTRAMVGLKMKFGR